MKWTEQRGPDSYNASVSASAANCAPNNSNGRDEAHTGPNAGNAWWGRWVTIERDSIGHESGRRRIRRHQVVNTRRVIRLGTLALALVAAAAFAIQLSPQFAAAAPGGTPVPAPTWRNPKLEAARRDTPPPAPPTQRPWNAQQPSDILANLPHDANFDNAMRALTGGADPDPRAVGRKPVLGAPLFVRGLRPSDGNEFLVPVVVDGTTIAIMVVPINRDGTGQLVATRGWSSAPSFPAQTADRAIALAGLTAQVTVRAELVSTSLRGLADEMSPFWRIERAGHAINYVFENGKVISASDLGIE